MKKPILIMLCVLFLFSLLTPKAQITYDPTSWTPITIENVGQLTKRIEFDPHKSTTLTFPHTNLIDLDDGGTILLAGIADLAALQGILQLWDVEAQSLLSEITIEQYYVDSVLSPDGNLIAVRTRDNISIWNTSKGMIVEQLPLNGIIANMTFTSDSQVLAFATEIENNVEVTLWDIQERKTTARLEHSYPNHLVFRSDGDHLVVFERDLGRINLWDVSQQVPTRSRLMPQAETFQLGPIRSNFNPDGSLLIYDTGFTLDTWDIPKQQEVLSLSSRGGNGFLFNRLSGTVFAYHDTSTLRLINVETMEELATVDDPVIRGINGAETIFLSGDCLGTNLRSVITGDVLFELISVDECDTQYAVNADSYHIRIDPHDRYIVVARPDGLVEFWGIPDE